MDTINKKGRINLPSRYWRGTADKVLCQQSQLYNMSDF